MRIVRLNESLEQAFWSHVNQDPLDYYFFILDWKLWKDKTKIWMATEDGRIEGLMMVYRDHNVQFRGSRRAVELLLEQLTLKEVELNAPLDCEDLIASKYVPRLRQEMILMIVKKGEENLQVATKPARLGIEDADEISALLREADPIWWGDLTGETLGAAMTEERRWYGIKRDSKIVSVGQTRLVDFGSVIGVAATKKGYRNRGYATSIVSTLVEEIFKTSATALIFVIKDNAPALRAYSKVGFKTFKSYLSMRTIGIRQG